MISEDDKIKTDFERSLSDFNKARREFLKIKVRHQILEDMLLHDGLPTEFHRRPEVVQYLNEVLVGNRLDKSNRIDPVLIQILKSQMKKILLVRVMSLLAHWPTPNHLSSESDYNRALLLPDLVRGEVECLKSRNELEHPVNLSATILLKHASLLNKFCHDLYLGSYYQFNATKIDYNLAKKKTLEMKLQALRQEVLASTYTPQAVKSLEKIRAEILKRQREVLAEVERTRASVAQYQMMGPEFETIVEKFTKVQQKIEGQKWSLNNLKKKD